MAIFTDISSAAVAFAIKAGALHVAWGRGLIAWDTTPVDPLPSAVALVDEVGRRAVSLVEFCIPDVAGAIIVANGRFFYFNYENRYLHVIATFDNADAVGEDIREAAVYVGTVVDPLVPPSQYYFQQADLDSAGVLLLLERFSKITRTVDFSTSLEFVMTL